MNADLLKYNANIFLPVFFNYATLRYMFDIRLFKCLIMIFQSISIKNMVQGECVHVHTQCVS